MWSTLKWLGLVGPGNIWNELRYKPCKVAILGQVETGRSTFARALSENMQGLRYDRIPCHVFADQSLEVWKWSGSELHPLQDLKHLNRVPTGSILVIEEPVGMEDLLIPALSRTDCHVIIVCQLLTQIPRGKRDVLDWIALKHTSVGLGDIHEEFIGTRMPLSTFANFISHLTWNETVIVSRHRTDLVVHQAHTTLVTAPEPEAQAELVEMKTMTSDRTLP
jgi:hypothetical protein